MTSPEADGLGLPHLNRHLQPISLSRYFLVWVVLSIKPKESRMLGNNSTTELYLQSRGHFFIVILLVYYLTFRYLQVLKGKQDQQGILALRRQKQATLCWFDASLVYTRVLGQSGLHSETQTQMKPKTTSRSFFQEGFVDPLTHNSPGQPRLSEANLLSCCFCPS